MSFVEVALGISFLIICNITDLKNKTIYRSICMAFFIVCVLTEILLYQESFKTILLGLIPGILIYALSIFTNEAIGKGDAWILGILGIIIGFIDCFILLIISLFCVVVFSIPIFLRKKTLKLRVPFSPFILISYLLFLVV